MDLDLNPLGSAAAELDALEAALGESAHLRARDALDSADAELEAVRAQWRGLAPRERALLARLATPVSARRDALARRVPAVRALSEGAAEPDAEEGPDEPGLATGAEAQQRA